MDQTEDGAIPDPRTFLVDAEIEVRSAAKRELDVRVVPWGVAIDTLQGREMFARGAFDGTDPDGVMLMGVEHEAHFGLGQDGRPVLTRHVTGKAIALDDREDGQHATFRVARTQAGDEILALAADKIIKGVSVEFTEIPNGTEVSSVNGRRTRVHNRARLAGVSPTYRPAYADAAILAVRSKDDAAAGEAPMQDQEAPVGAEPQPVDLTPVTSSITQMRTAFDDRFAALEERMRANFTIPAGEVEPRTIARGEWMGTVLKMLAGERIPDQQMRVMADLVTGDNVGVVPDAYMNELIGVIDPSRPFLSSTRRMDLPTAGMSLVVPKIVTRPTTGVQAVYGDESYPEKSEITSTATSITNVSYDAVTIAGGGDISIQLLRRSSPSYLGLFLELLGEALAFDAETNALTSLLATLGAPAGVNDGGNLDPENMILGPAWTAGAAVRKPINTMWLSSNAVGAFIDAKANGTNAPLYSTIQAGFTAGGGTGGTISGLRPIWVPALDGSGTDVLVGPSAGFGWTEDGAFNLQVDVPSKAGRDVALVTIMWFAPMYPTAFTGYALAS